MADLVKKESTALANWEEELKKDAVEAGASESMPSGSFVGTRGGVLKVGGVVMKGNKMSVVVLDYIMENHLYSSSFDPDSPAAPICYAFGRDEAEMAPHDDAPQPQHQDCGSCPKNEWGSAETGRGKACKNIRRLALISADDLSPDAIANGEVVFLRLPVTSTNAWKAYVKGVASANRPPWGVITEVTAVPDHTTMFKITFKAVGEVDGPTYAALRERREKVKGQIEFPYAAGSVAESVREEKF